MSLYQFLEELNLLSTHKYSFRSNNSCINQLLFIDHTLYKAFQVFFWICSKLLITFGVKGYFIEGYFISTNRKICLTKEKLLTTGKNDKKNVSGICLYQTLLPLVSLRLLWSLDSNFYSGPCFLHLNKIPPFFLWCILW